MLVRALLALCIVAILPAASNGAADNTGLSEVMTLDRQAESMKEGGVGPVRYTHAAHALRYKCAECHPKIFLKKINGNEISMKKNMEQKFCGSPNCHNSAKAFPLYMCDKCHTNVPVVKPRPLAKEKAKKKAK